jgi:hypothetical protein
MVNFRQREFLTSDYGKSSFATRYFRVARSAHRPAAGPWRFNQQRAQILAPIIQSPDDRIAVRQARDKFLGTLGCLAPRNQERRQQQKQPSQKNANPAITVAAMAIPSLVLEPIATLPEENEQASELDETEEVLRVELPTDQQMAPPLNPGKEAFDISQRRVYRRSLRRSWVGGFIPI